MSTWLNYLHRSIIHLPCILCRLFCLLLLTTLSTTKSMAQQRSLVVLPDSLEAFKQKLRQLSDDGYHKSLGKYSSVKLEQKQAVLIEALKSTMRRARVLLGHQPDTTALDKTLTSIERWFSIGIDGIFTNKGSAQSHRNLTTSTVLLTELQRMTDDRKQSIDKYHHDLSAISMYLDSLNTDSALYYFPDDSATLAQYLNKIVLVSHEVSPTDSALKKAIISVYSIQNRINLLQVRISTALEEMNNYHRSLSDNTFNREFANIWEEPTNRRPFHEILYYSKEKATLSLFFYVRNHWGLVLLLLVLLIAATVFLSSLKKRAVSTDEFYPEKTPLILRYPFLSATMIVFCIFQFLFPAPPFIFNCIFWIVATICLTIIFRGFISRSWMIAWLAMAIQFFLACGDNLILQASRVERYYLLLASVAGLITGSIILIRGRRSELRERSILWFIAFVVLLEAGATFFNLYGRYNYAKTLYVSGFVNVIVAICFLWTVRLVNEGLLIASEVYKQPERKSFFINFEKVGKKAPAIFYIFLIAGWFIIFGRNFYAFRMITDPVQDFLISERSIGQYSFTIKSMLLFFGIIIIAAIISKVVSFFASDKNVSHTSEPSRPGLGSWLLLIRITIISMGIFLAFAAAGMPLDKITIILGALGVGVGLGLQALVNNLVSGLILAFEKPVNVGDLIDVAGKTGTIKSIGFRSSMITSLDGATVVIPNGDLLKEHLVSWAQGRGSRRIELNVGVAYDTDLQKVIPLIEKLLQENKKTIAYPAPAVFATEFKDSSVELKLLFWIGNSKDLYAVKSEVISQILVLFNKEGVSIPFPQQDLHIHNDGGLTGQTPPATP